MNLKNETINKLIELAILLEEIGKTTKDDKMQFLSHGLKAVLHASQNSQLTNLFIKHIKNYIKEYALMNEEITIQEYLQNKIPTSLN